MVKVQGDFSMVEVNKVSIPFVQYDLIYLLFILSEMLNNLPECESFSSTAEISICASL